MVASEPSPNNDKLPLFPMSIQDLTSNDVAQGLIKREPANEVAVIGSSTSPCYVSWFKEAADMIFDTDIIILRRILSPHFIGVAPQLLLA